MGKTGTPTRTPWGPAQDTTEVATGVARYDTAGHGGYHVADDVRSHWPAPLRTYETFAGGNWFEEDCDWAVVCAAMPHLFPEQAHEAALNTLRGMSSATWCPQSMERDNNMRRIALFFVSDEGMSFAEKVARWHGTDEATAGPGPG